MTSYVHRIRAVAVALALVSAGTAAAQQTATITGRVLTTENAPLRGASVGIPELAVGAFAGEDGRYSFDVPAAQVRGQQVTLTARMLGRTPESVTITLRPGTINQDFSLGVYQLGEVVVTALGIERERRSLGHSVQEVSGAEITRAPEANLVNALSGKVSGVAITNAGPQGGSSRIVIRGASSIAGNNQPLFIVDGVPVDNRAPANTYAGRPGYGGHDYGNVVADINPNDIEAISVLKGPNAAALYGSRAANGAIVITTKSGQSGIRGLGISATTSVTFESPLRLPNYQNEFGQGSGGQFSFVDGAGGGVNDGVDESWGPRLDGQPRAQFFGTGPWVAQPDNVRNFFETGRTVTSSVALAGATDRANVRFAVGNQYLDGVFPANQLRRLNVSLAGGAALHERLKTDASFQYISNDGRNRPGTGYDVTNPMQQFIWFGRQVDTRMLRQRRTPAGEQYNWNYNYHNNPYWLSIENPNSDDRDRIIASGSVTVELASWLEGSIRGGTDWYRDRRRRNYAAGTIGGVFDRDNFYDVDDGGFFEDQLFNQEMNTDALLTARHGLTRDLGLVVNFGGNIRMSSFEESRQGTDRLVVPGVYNIGNSAVKPIVYQWQERKRIHSLYGQAQFALSDYLFLDLTGRNDWSSTLPDSNNSYFYPSASLSYVFSEMLFPGGSPFSFGKVRASWARVGNDADPYQLASVYTANTTFGAIPRYTVPNLIPNANLKPEQTTAWEAGTELRFLDNRLGLDLTYYDKATTNQILSAQVSAATGFSNVVLNAGEISNRGVELLLDARAYERGRFSWDLSVNFGRNRSQVEKLYGDLQTVSLNGTGYWGLTVEARLNEPYGALYGNPYLRDEQGRLILEDGLPLADPQKRVLGHYPADWTGGVHNAFTFGPVDFSFLFDIKRGGDLFTVTHMFGRYAGVLEESLEGRRCTGTGASATCEDGLIIAGVNEDGSPNTTKVSAQAYNHALYGIHEAHIFDASYVKLREMRLGWRVPQRFAARVGASALDVALIGRNLRLWTDMPHIDPETAFNASNAQGLEFGQLPSVRSIGLTVSVAP